MYYQNEVITLLRGGHFLYESTSALRLHIRWITLKYDRLGWVACLSGIILNEVGMITSAEILKGTVAVEWLHCRNLS